MEVTDATFRTVVSSEAGVVTKSVHNFNIFILIFQYLHTDVCVYKKYSHVLLGNNRRCVIHSFIPYA